MPSPGMATRSSVRGCASSGNTLSAGRRRTVSMSAARAGWPRDSNHGWRHAIRTAARPGGGPVGGRCENRRRGVEVGVGGGRAPAAVRRRRHACRCPGGRGPDGVGRGGGQQVAQQARPKSTQLDRDLVGLKARFCESNPLIQRHPSERAPQLAVAAFARATPAAHELPGIWCGGADEPPSSPLPLI